MAVAEPGRPSSTIACRRVGRIFTMANSVATEKPLARTSSSASPRKTHSMWGLRGLKEDSGEGSEERLEPGVALQGVEHRIRGEPALDLGAIHHHGLLQEGQRIGLAAPERLESGQVVVEQQILGVQRARLLIG